MDDSREEIEHCRDRHCTDESSGKNGREARETEDFGGNATAEQQHHQSDGERGSTGDAEDARSCQRIVESGLQKQSADRQRRAAERGCDGLWQARFHDDETPRFFRFAASQKDVDDFGKRNFDRTDKQIEQKQQYKNEGKGNKGK
ncbi:MAG: hypothetical protein IKT22_09365 [Prevotella sp.]|nr:hypothetical protein [Prevotella sp.]